MQRGSKRRHAVALMLLGLPLCLPPSARALPAPRFEAVTLLTPTGILHGTLELPKRRGPYPVALIIAGSGPTDRNGNDAAAGLETNCYLELADALARDGIASLRYDKRGSGQDSLLSVPRFGRFVSDAVRWGRWLEKDPRFSSLTVIGHSEGSLVGMLAAPKLAAAGYVSIAGAGRPVGQVLLTQLKPKLTPALYKTAESIIASLEHGRTIDQVPTSLDALFRPSIQPFLIGWMAYQPMSIIARLKQPTLIIQGERDIQVEPLDARMLAKADPGARLVLIPGMNHVFKDVGPSMQANLQSYGDPRLPIDPTLTRSIAHFILTLNPLLGVHHAHAH